MVVQQGMTAMTMILGTLTMMAFAAVYAAILAMVGNRATDLLAALGGQPVLRQAGVTEPASRRFSLA
ncbi:MAG: hypothetical protein DCF31_05695 [Alphaproteobacteria bacterium]|nr:MAG: hypothetical protein DCF31_05695 [Alphaproteobacteria bacterium]